MGERALPPTMDEPSKLKLQRAKAAIMKMFQDGADDEKPNDVEVRKCLLSQF